MDVKSALRNVLRLTGRSDTTARDTPDRQAKRAKDAVKIIAILSALIAVDCLIRLVELIIGAPEPFALMPAVMGLYALLTGVLALWALTARLRDWWFLGVGAFAVLFVITTGTMRLLH